MKRSILAAAVAAAVLAPSAHAQMAPVANPFHVGVSGGISFPTSDAAGVDGSVNAKSKSGYNVNGHLGFSVPMFPLGLRADVGYNKFEGKDFTDEDGVTGRANTGVISGTLNAIIKPAGIMPMRPYLIGGIGAYRVKIDGEVSDLGESFTATTKKTSFGLNGGAGINFSLGELSTFLEARYHYVMNKEDCSSNSDDVCIEHKSTSFVPVSFGIMF